MDVPANGEILLIHTLHLFLISTRLLTSTCASLRLLLIVAAQLVDLPSDDDKYEYESEYSPSICDFSFCNYTNINNALHLCVSPLLLGYLLFSKLFRE